MTHKIGVLVIHGIGSQKAGYSLPMQEEVDRRLSKLGVAQGDVRWSEVFWADVLEAKQRAYFRRMGEQHDLDYMKLRKFMLTAFADASAYRRIPGQSKSIYNKIHGRIKTAVNQLDNGQNPLLVVLAHSLGGHIISNYIYDVRKCVGDPAARNCNTVMAGVDSDFKKLRTMCGIVTFGCNIPLFTFALPNAKPVAFRGDMLSSGQAGVAEWRNYFDPDDILAYPLRAINRYYRDGVTSDIAINVGGIFSSWNPISHIGYWTDNDFTKPISRYLKAVCDVA